MLYCEKIENHRIGNRTPNADIAQSLGWTITIEESQTERAYDGSLWEKGFAPKKPLEELKTEKRVEINQARDKAEQSGFEYLGKVFDSDQVSCQRISMAAQAMALAPEGTTITWTCQDNTSIDLNAEQLVGMVAALAAWSNQCHQKANALKAQIESVETAEELELIQWNEAD